MHPHKPPRPFGGLNRGLKFSQLKGDLALEMIFWIWIFGAKMNFFYPGQEKSWIIGRNIFRIPLISTVRFQSFLPILTSFWGLYFGRGWGGCTFICLCIRTRVEYPGQEGWNHPFPRSIKMVISSTQLKLFCLTSTQTGNLKMACQHPSCSVSIQKGAVNKHSDWR